MHARPAYSTGEKRATHEMRERSAMNALQGRMFLFCIIVQSRFQDAGIEVGCCPISVSNLVSREEERSWKQGGDPFTFSSKLTPLNRKLTHLGIRKRRFPLLSP